MNSVTDTRVTVGAMLARMEALEIASRGESVRGSSPLAAGAPDFAQLLRDAVREVNVAQNTAQAKAQSFQLGDGNVSLEDVMISMQQASLALQGMVAVRNKLVEAYREVSNLQV